MHILVVTNQDNPQAIDASAMLAGYFSQLGLAATYMDVAAIPAPCAAADWISPDPEPDLVITLGGDGSMLRSARVVQKTGAPILGINFGHMGFLTNHSDDGVVKIVSAALAGDMSYERRTTLSLDAYLRGRKDPIEGIFGLNEAALTRGSNRHIVTFTLSISGSAIATMDGDGLLVSTATGSTAYGLSAGGPIIAPGFTGLEAVPVSPHTIRSRSIVTGPEDVIEVELAESNVGTTALMIDGEIMEFEAPVERIVVRPGEIPASFLRYKTGGFYQKIAGTFF